MTTDEVLRKVRDAVGSHTGDERELFEALEAEAEGGACGCKSLTMSKTDGTSAAGRAFDVPTDDLFAAPTDGQDAA